MATSNPTEKPAEGPPLSGDEKKSPVDASESHADLLVGPNGEIYPTAEELATLRYVRGKIGWIIYTIAIVEMVERFAYYGTTTIFSNFIQFPRPEGSRTGAGEEGQSGAMGMGQQASTGLTLFNAFWAYLMPLLGGYLSDTYWGKYKTINVGIASATFGHILIVISAIPAVLDNQKGSLATFIIGLLFFGIGVGFFKSNISPLIAEQYEAKAPRATVETLPSGEKVIVDPHKTYAIIYMRYYFFINIGVMFGQVSMVYAEKYVGFWLAFLLPTILFFFCPVIMVICRNRYVQKPPTGSVLSKATGLWVLAMKKHWSWNPIRTVRNMRSGGFWESVKPSRLGDSKPAWMTFDDNWVDEVRRGFKACSVFVYYPIFWLPYNQLYNNLTSQAATLRLDGFPNDLVNNLDPIALLIFIPLFDKFFYPWMDRARIRVTPIRKITTGFIMAVLAMIVAALIQHYIYVQSPCGDDASSCDTPPDISVWVQTPAYVLIAFSEIGASITGLEYAFTKAPKNMRGLVTGMFWFAQAFSAAMGQAFVPFAKDPLLVWLYTTIAILTTIAGLAFWFTFRHLDREEEELNALPDSVFVGNQNKDTIDIEAAKAAEIEQQKLRHLQGLDKRLQKVEQL